MTRLSTTSSSALTSASMSSTGVVGSTSKVALDSDPADDVSHRFRSDADVAKLVELVVNAPVDIAPDRGGGWSRVYDRSRTAACVHVTGSEQQVEGRGGEALSTLLVLTEQMLILLRRWRIVG